MLASKNPASWYQSLIPSDLTIAPVTQRLPCFPEKPRITLWAAEAQQGSGAGGAEQSPLHPVLLCIIQINERIFHRVAETGVNQFISSFWEEATKILSWKLILLTSGETWWRALPFF